MTYLNLERQAKRILQAIDFVNHSTVGKAVVTGSHVCSDHDTFYERDYPATFPEGEIIFRENGYIRDSSDPFLDRPYINSERIPLLDLHKFWSHHRNASVVEWDGFNPVDEPRPNIQEFNNSDVLSAIIGRSYEWNVYDVPLTIADAYVELMDVELQLNKASVEFNHWHNAVHSTPNYTQKEMSADPHKKCVMEEEQRIHSLHATIRKKYAPLITEVYSSILKNNAMPVPEKHLFYKGFDDTPSADLKLNSHMHFILATYPTFKAQNVFDPIGKRTDSINSVDKILEEAHKVLKTSPM